MKIFSWNVNGLRAVLKKNFYDFVASHAPDVLCLQETKISMQDALALDIPFKYKYFNCAEKKGYSGTAIFSNEEPLDVQSVQLEGHPDEGRILCANFAAFYLVNVYVPNSKTELERLSYRTQSFDADFRRYLKGLAKTKGVIVCGDLNVAHEEIDLARPADNHFSAGFTDEERASFAAHLKNGGLIDVWRALNPERQNKYSWWSYRGGARDRNVGWRIDYFLCTPDIFKKVKDADIHDDVTGSDHCPVSVTLGE